MMLALRMVVVIAAAVFRRRVSLGRPASAIGLRVLPNDLDVNLHLNNGRYHSFCDLGRADLLCRTGLLRLMLERGWSAVVAENTMTYKKSLGLFQKFRLESALTEWDDRFFYTTHTCIYDGRVVAHGRTKGAIVAKTDVVSPATIIALLA